MSTIGKYFSLIGGGTPSTKNIDYWGEGFPWISSSDIDRKGNVSYNRYVTKFGVDNSSTNIVPADTLVVVTRVGMGKVCILPKDMCFSQDIQALIPKEELKAFYAPFFKYQLLYLMSKEKYNGQGTTISGITKKHLSDIEIYIPTEDEQRRIVAKIEELFSQLDSGVETLKKTKAQLAVYRQAVLKEAFESAAADSNAVEMLSIDQLLVTNRKGMATGPFGTMIKKQDHKTSGVPMLGIENIGHGKFVDGNKIFVTEEKAVELKAFTLLEGDIIISRSGTVGEICAVPKRMEGSLLSTNLMRVSLNSSIVCSEYFIYLFQSKGVVLDQVKELCKGSTRMFLNQTILKQIVFPVPNIEKQKAIVSLIESRLSVCDSIEKTVDNALQQAEGLRQSILKKAFEGGL